MENRMGQELKVKDGGRRLCDSCEVATNQDKLG